MRIILITAAYFPMATQSLREVSSLTPGLSWTNGGQAVHLTAVG